MRDNERVDALNVYIYKWTQELIKRTVCINVDSHNGPLKDRGLENVSHLYT